MTALLLALLVLGLVFAAFMLERPERPAWDTRPRPPPFPVWRFRRPLWRGEHAGWVVA